MKSPAQSKWQAYNDSCFNKTKSFYDACRQLTSNKMISIEQFDIDQKLIKLLNGIYHDPSFTLHALKENSRWLKNSTIHQIEQKDTITLEFNANAEGNLDIAIKAILKGTILTLKYIYLSTKTQVLCNNDYWYVNALDFLYLKRLIPEINFPIALKPYQANLEIKPGE
jgi:hypothetical protein